MNPLSSPVDIAPYLTGPLAAAAMQPAITLGRTHARRLREIYRSAGWPCQDMLEIELLAGGMLQRVDSPAGHETLRVSDAGVAWLAATLAVNRSTLSAHEALVERVACEMVRAGRIAWRTLSLRAQLPPAAEGEKARWCMVRPDVFSIRNTTVETYLEPIVHEIKVKRSDLLGDLRRPDKRGAYLDLGGECWYVLGCDAKGRPIGAADEIPVECGVMQLDNGRLVVTRSAPRRSRQNLPLGVWMALAKATPVAGINDGVQGLLGECV
ncbi:FIG00931906: hypothetical protein [Polaromonas sp. CG9_12]|nr:FIG00931906: hypothetical protein [Polaromonas sp. CG9_12]